MSKRIGFIGLGIMGLPMASRLAEAGYSLIVWNRTPQKAEKLKERGVSVASSPAELASAAEYIVVMVSDDTASRSVLLGDKGVYESIKEGSVIINHSTVTPMHSIEMYRIFKQRGVHYLEVPVMGSRGAAEKGTLLSMVGGDKELLASISGILKTYSREIIYIGPIGHATALKLAINSIFFNSVQALAEAIALVEAWGIGASKLFEVADRLWIKVIVDRYGRRLLADEYPVNFRLVLAAKDLMYTVQAGYEKKQSLPLTSAAAQTYLKAATSGLGDKDYSRIFKFLRYHKV